MTYPESYPLISPEAVKRAFSPSAPIQRRDLFAGRQKQLAWVHDALDEPGQHVVIYGERGVGKTSLATICAEMAQARSQTAVMVNCYSGDDFGSISRRVFKTIAVEYQFPIIGFSNGVRREIGSAVHYLSDVKDITPDVICNAMIMLTQRSPIVIFLDEFDCVSNPRVHRFLASTLKTISDKSIPVTIVLVGVADNVNELVREHASVERAMVQVHMPRMSEPELAAIVKKGLNSVKMGVEQSAVDQITMLSQGLPNYTHLLTQQAALIAVWRSSHVVTVPDVNRAIEAAIQRTEASICELYSQATHSNRNNMYKQVVLACACAVTDEKGFFTASAVRSTLSIIMDKPYMIAQFSRHLSALCEEDRGPILKSERRYQQTQYRFTKPLLQPYVTMRGLRDRMIDSDTLKACGKRVVADDWQYLTPPRR